jgi:uncharacterized protein YjiS (DUF1127 family)
MLRTSGEASGAIASPAIDAPFAPPRGLLAWCAKPLATVWVWTERVRQRRALAQLDDRLLRDIDLTHAQVWQEVSKPFWRG